MRHEYEGKYRMQKRVREYIEEWNMLNETDKVVVGVSGGADSICLLFVLSELRKQVPFELLAVHVNHCLRGEAADADEAFVQAVCKKMRIPCMVYREQVELIAKSRKQSIEEAGREVRRACFQEAFQEWNGTKIALAHHRDDNVETFLLNLSRGTGIKGLGGIRPVTGVYIRPLLCVTRKEIESYLKQQEIGYCEDQTNQSDAYTRNRIRNNVVPYLETHINPNAAVHIGDTIEQVQKMWEYITDQVEKATETCVTNQGVACVIHKEAFYQVNQALRGYVLKRALTQITRQEKDIESIHIKQLEALFEKQVGKRIDLPYQVQALRIYDGVKLQRELQNKEEMPLEQRIQVSEELQEVFCGDKILRMHLRTDVAECRKCAQKSNTKWFDYGIMGETICIRTRRAGDYITIHPDGRRQKLKTYFINEKIPQEERERILLVADGSHILWILGYRAGCAGPIDENTKCILEIQMIEGEKYGRED